MSMNRNDVLGQLSVGLHKFEGHTAAQFLASGWAGIKGMHTKDIEYFTLHGDKLVRTIDPLARPNRT
jgi:hypothetical protein